MANIRYKIRYRLKTGNDGQLETYVHAPDSGKARRIFEQSNPGAIFSECREDKEK